MTVSKTLLNTVIFLISGFERLTKAGSNGRKTED